MKTIQSKILFVVITALIVITAIVTSIAVGVPHNIMHKDADRILNNVSLKEAAYINDMLNDFMQSSAIMEHYALHELSSVSALNNESYRDEYIAEICHLFDEVALNTAGTTAYYLCFSPEVTGGVTSGFYSKFKEDGVYELSKAEFAELDLFNAQFIKESGFDAYFVDHTAGVYPQAASGMSFTTAFLQSKGDIITDLNEDLAAEQKARTTYDNILRLTDDPDVREPIKFLRAREIVHYQRFAEALGIATEKAECKNNFYITNPSFDVGCKPCCSTGQSSERCSFNTESASLTGITGFGPAKQGDFTANTSRECKRPF